ncbi:MAG: YfhO family protein [Desulfobacterium sp.]|nr:YfhO family protein [Desulfobacterium sp.]
MPDTLTFRWFALAGLAVVILFKGWPGKRPGRREPGWQDAALIYWVVLLAFFWKAFLLDLCMVPADIAHNYYPWKAFANGVQPHNPLLVDIAESVFPWMNLAKDTIAAGELPLWNFSSYCGTPFAANLVSAAFHPFRLLLFVMAPEDLATVLPFLRIFIAAMGMFLLLKNWRLSWTACLTGGFIFAFCGVHMVWLSNYPEINVTMLMPWIFLCADRIAKQGNLLWLVGLAFLSVLQFLGGHPETSFHLYAGVIPFFFWLLYREGKKGVAGKILVQRVSMFAGAGVLGLLLAAVQLLPFLEYLPLTSRYQEISRTGGNLFLSLDFIEVFKNITATLVNPDFFGNPVDGNFWGYSNYNEQNTHITVTGALLAFAAIFNRRENHGEKAFFMVAGLLAFLVAVRTPGVFELVVSLPLFKHAGNHRLIFFVSFFLSILAAFSVSDIKEDKGVAPGPVLAGALLMVLMAVGFHFSTSAHLTNDQMIYRVSKLCLFLIYLGAGLLVFVAGAKFRSVKGVAPMLFCGLVVIEIFAWASDYNTFIRRDAIFPTTPVTDFLKSKTGRSRVVSLPGVLMKGSELVFGFDSPTGMDPMKTANFEKIMSRVSGRYSAINTFELNAFDSPWLDFLNVKYYVAGPSSSGREFGREDLFLAFQGPGATVFRAGNAFSRAFWVDRVILEDSHEKAFAITLDHEDMLDTVAVFEPGDDTVKKYSIPVKGEIDPDDVAGHDQEPEILETGSKKVTLRVEPSRARRYLVLGMQFYPGWHLMIDGRESNLFRADYAFMGAVVPPGAQRLEFFYDSSVVRTGIGLSLGGLVVTLICLVLGILKTRKRFLPARRPLHG